MNRAVVAHVSRRKCFRFIRRVVRDRADRFKFMRGNLEQVKVEDRTAVDIGKYTYYPVSAAPKICVLRLILSISEIDIINLLLKPIFPQLPP